MIGELKDKELSREQFSEVIKTDSHPVFKNCDLYIGVGETHFAFEEYDLKVKGAVFEGCRFYGNHILSRSEDILVTECEFGTPGNKEDYTFHQAKRIHAENCLFNTNLVFEESENVSAVRCNFNNGFYESTNAFVVEGTFVNGGMFKSLKPVVVGSRFTTHSAVDLSDDALVLDCHFEGENPFNYTENIKAYLPGSRIESIGDVISGIIIINRVDKVYFKPTEESEVNPDDTKIFAVDVGYTNKDIIKIEPDDLVPEKYPETREEAKDIMDRTIDRIVSKYCGPLP